MQIYQNPDKVRTIWLVRHANRQDFVTPEWFNTAERPYDPPLSADGMVQARELTKILSLEKTPQISQIFSSPFLRTVQTAHELATSLDLSIKLESGLSEWLNPDWMSEPPQTHPWEWLKQKYPSLDLTYRPRVIPKYPETEITLKQRTKTTAQLLTSEFEGDLLLVGHSLSLLGIIESLVAESPPMKIPLGGIVQLSNQAGQWRINWPFSDLTS